MDAPAGGGRGWDVPAAAAATAGAPIDAEIGDAAAATAEPLGDAN